MVNYTELRIIQSFLATMHTLIYGIYRLLNRPLSNRQIGQYHLSFFDHSMALDWRQGHTSYGTTLNICRTQSKSRCYPKARPTVHLNVLRGTFITELSEKVELF